MSFPDFFFNFLERRFGVNDAIAWAYTIFENIKLFRSSEIMSHFYAVLIGKVSFGLGPVTFIQIKRAFVPAQDGSTLATAPLVVEEGKHIHQPKGDNVPAAQGDDKC